MLKRIITIPLMLLTGIVITPTIVLAYAAGTETWGGFDVTIGEKGVSTTVHVPAGALTHVIWGDGYNITGERAFFNSAKVICEPSVKFTYGYGSYYHNTNVNPGCSVWGKWDYAINWNAPRGDACAELWEKNWRVRVARQCHYISP